MFLFVKFSRIFLCMWIIFISIIVLDCSNFLSKNLLISVFLFYRVILNVCFKGSDLDKEVSYVYSFFCLRVYILFFGI